MESIQQLAATRNIWLNPISNKNDKRTIKQKYSFINTLKFAYGTDGCYESYNQCDVTLDLLQNPSNSSSNYNFTQSSIAIENVLLKPYIVTDNIPISYSNHVI